MQKKILKLIYFRRKFAHSEELFVIIKVLTVYELHIYELLKFVSRSFANLHSAEFLDNLFTVQMLSRFTRIERCPVQFRALKLLNSLLKQNILPQEPTSLAIIEIEFFHHDLKFSDISNSMEFFKYIFAQ